MCEIAAICLGSKANRKTATQFLTYRAIERPRRLRLVQSLANLWCQTTRWRRHGFPAHARDRARKQLAVLVVVREDCETTAVREARVHYPEEIGSQKVVVILRRLGACASLVWRLWKVDTDVSERAIDNVVSQDLRSVSTYDCQVLEVSRHHPREAVVHSIMPQLHGNPSCNT